MTYGQFLALFLGVPLAVLLLAHHNVDRRLVLTLAVLSVVAVAYTAPWDNLIIVNGVWSYRRHQILGVLIGHVPLEECVFYVLQVCLTGLLTAAVVRGRR